MRILEKEENGKGENRKKGEMKFRMVLNSPTL
jgi:hypothetical protein